MRLAVIVLLLSLAALVVFYFSGVIKISPTTIDIHSGSTFIVTTYTSFAVVTVWCMGTLFALAGLIGSGFRKGIFWLLLLLFVTVGAFLFYKYVYL